MILRHHAHVKPYATRVSNDCGGDLFKSTPTALQSSTTASSLPGPLGLADIVAILADADGFRMEFFTSSPADRRRRATRDARRDVGSKLLRRQLRSGNTLRTPTASLTSLSAPSRSGTVSVRRIEAFGFTPRAYRYANRDQFDVVFFAQRGDHGRRFGRLTGMRINGIPSPPTTPVRQRQRLYAGTQAGIKAHCGAQASGAAISRSCRLRAKYVNRFIFRVRARCPSVRFRGALRL